MLPVWHAIVAAFYWLHAHLVSVGISAVVTAIGGGIMWPLILRKTRLEIEHLRLDTKRLEFEVQKLADEKTQREATKADHTLGERIADLARDHLKKHPVGHSVPFSEEDLISQLNETPEAIRRALAVLRNQGRARFTSVTASWIIQA